MDEAVEVVENIPKLPLASVIAVAVGGFIMGCTTGYVIAKRVLEPKYAALSEQEIAEAKEFYKRLNKRGEFATPEGAASELLPAAADALRSYQGRDEDSEEEPETGPEVEVVIESVFNKPEFEWDAELELARRPANRPYVVSKEEWDELDPDLEMVTLTYYAGDEALADARDEPIANVEAVVGTDNLKRFGHGSEDPRVVYIVNNQLPMAFEVLLHDGKFAHEVLGFEHGERLALHDRRPARRMRVLDE